MPDLIFGIRCYLTSTSLHSSTESSNFVFINSWFFFRDCLDSRNFARHQLCFFFHPTSQLNYKQMFFYDQQIPHRPGATTLTLAACPWLWSVFASQLCLPVHDSLNCLCTAVPCLHPWEASNWLCLGLLSLWCLGNDLKLDSKDLVNVADRRGRQSVPALA